MTNKRVLFVVVLIALSSTLILVITSRNHEVSLHSTKVHQRAISAIVVVSELNSVFTAGEDSFIRQLDLATLTEVTTLDGNGHAILCGSRFHDKRVLAFGCTNGDIIVVDLRAELESTRIPIGRQGITGLSACANLLSIGTIDGDLFLLRGRDKIPRAIGALAKDKRTGSKPSDIKIDTVRSSPLHNGKVRSIRINRDASALFSLGTDGLIVYDLINEQIANRYEVAGDLLEISGDGHELVVCGTTNQVFRISGNDLEKTDEKPGHLATTTGTGISEDGRYLATCGSEGTLMVWEFPLKRRLLAIETRPRTQLCTVCFVPGNRLLCGDINGKLIWIDVP